MIDIIVLALVLGTVSSSSPVTIVRQSSLPAWARSRAAQAVRPAPVLTVAAGKENEHGRSTGSMFYFFILILVIYFVSVGIYQLIQLIRKHK
ncbi:MAG: hypothetical protein ACLVJX_08730 [Merdibacter sp.]